MPVETVPLSRRLDRFLHQTDDANTTLILLALKELASGLEAVEERTSQLAKAVRDAAAETVRPEPRSNEP